MVMASGCLAGCSPSGTCCAQQACLGVRPVSHQGPHKHPPLRLATSVQTSASFWHQVASPLSARQPPCSITDRASVAYCSSAICRAVDEDSVHSQ